MDYIKNKCQVCDKEFVKGDDIVVCPECGTPHHRECYVNLGHCVNSDKHSQGFDYLAEIKKQNDENKESHDGELTTCKVCGSKNRSDARFCSTCGNPISEFSNQGANSDPVKPPFSPVAGAPNIIVFDPLAGIKPDTDLGDGVTVGETAKFVKQNTPYFSTVFNNIKKFSKSRFNFCAAIFSGLYLLYRKMYKIGAIITTIEILIMVASTYLAHFISTDPAFSQVATALSQYDTMLYLEKLSALSSLETFVYFTYVILGFVSLAISITIGFVANRLYFNHCKKQISKIKNSVEKPEDIDTELKRKGGVNIGIVLSLWISYIILSYLPRLFY